jgi:hypothetical protein
VQQLMMVLARAGWAENADMKSLTARLEYLAAQ